MHVQGYAIHTVTSRFRSELMAPFPKATRTYSFDVFDTCITRMHAYPRDLFFDLGLRLAPSSDDDSSKVRFAKRFQRARIRAEKIANWRARPEREQGNIYDIYRNLRYLIRLNQTVPELVQLELTLEEESIFPIDDAVERIGGLRKTGHRILFISDMYIPARLLGPLLQRKGVMQEGDGLYVSCDFGVTKHSGKLFSKVLEFEKLSPSDIQHTGDNEFADVANAESLGIRALHFSAAHLTAREARLAGLKLPRQSFASWIAGLSRRARLSMRHELRPESEHPLSDVVFGVVTPFLLAYVQWILEDARDRGIKRLYFVARDGEALFKIAKEFSPADIELRYLYGSRRAWLAPSIVDGHLEWKRLLAVTGDACAPADIAARAGLDAAQIDQLRSAMKLDEACWKRSMVPDEADAFINRMMEQPEASEIVRAATHAKREDTLGYLKQEGLLEHDSWALVDSGWSLNSQAALKRILDLVDKDAVPPKGYYLGLARDHLSEAQAGRAFAFTAPAGSIFSRRRVVIEHLFLPATHASTRSYKRIEGKFAPELKDESRDEIELAYALHLHRTAALAARMVAQDEVLRDRLKEFTPFIRKVAESFITHPTREDALASSQFSAVADMRQERAFARPLCRELQMRDVWTTMAMAISKRARFRSDSWMWLEGSAALSKHMIKWPIRSMLWLDGVKNRLKLSD